MAQWQNGTSSRRASLKTNNTHSSYIIPTKITQHVIINTAKTAYNAGSAAFNESCRRLITSTSENVVVRYMCV